MYAILFTMEEEKRKEIIGEEKHDFNASLVWFFASLSLFLYGILVLYEIGIPGIRDIFSFLESIPQEYIYFTAGGALFFEGLYIVGNFFPGTTIVALIAVLSSFFGYQAFFFTLFALWIGWVSAGAVNIFVSAFFYKKKKIKTPSHSSLKDNIFFTWYPSFRASYEVALVLRGEKPLTVFLSSLRVKTILIILLLIGGMIVPYIFDVGSMSNEEGVITTFIASFLSLCVGVFYFRKYKKIKEKEGREEEVQ